MQSGTVCRCIKYFKALSSDELSLEIGDIVQVHEVVDKIWLKGQSNDLCGKFPSNSVIEEDIPDIIGDAPLFVVANEFLGTEQGDLKLLKGQFVVGIRNVDESWWFGNCMGKEGMFPINFVWEIDRSLLKEKSGGEEKVSFYVKAKSTLQAQLPEELSLNAGDIVKVTHIIDKDWYRGEIGKNKGIFPRAFVEIVDFAVETQEPVKQEEIHSIPFSSHSEDQNCSLSGDVVSPHAVALFTFMRASHSELSFFQGDTIELIKHVDPFWTLGRKGDDEGIFPTSYIKIIVDCPRNSPMEFNAHSEDGISSQATTNTIYNTDLLEETEVDWSPQTQPIAFNNSNAVQNEIDMKSITTSEEVIDNNNTLPKSVIDEKFDGTVPYATISENLNPPANELTKELCDKPPVNPTLDINVLDNQDSYEKHSEAASSGHEEDLSSNCGGSPVESNSPELPRANESMRRHLVKELIETEYEYIHDLESFVQVVNISRNIREAASVEIDILLGNIADVITFSKSFLKKLHVVCYNDDDNMMAGTVFLDSSEKLCDVYKIYSSHHSLIVQPALQKYQSGGDSLVYLEYVMKELRQHKVKLMDMSAVLMKPVQRVLKYPLFIERLLGSTSPDHKDFRCLEEAKIKMQLVAKDINDYTRRLDLVKKYKSSSGHSLEHALQKMSVHSVAKKGSRLKTRLSATIGLFSQAKDPQFEEEVFQYRSMTKAANGIVAHGEKLLSVIDSRHLAELNVIEALASAYVVAPSEMLLEHARNAARDNYNRLFMNFKMLIIRRVLDPLKTLIQLCSGPERLLLKRSDKLLDFNQTEQRLERNKDPTRTRILEEEHLSAKGTFEALHTQLRFDLPKLTSYGVELLRMAMKTLVGLRMQLQGQLASSIIQVSADSEIATSSTDALEERVKTKLRAELSVLRNLEFLPPGYVPDSPLRKRKSTVCEPPESLISQHTTQPVASSYPPSSLYVVTTTCSGGGPMELNAKTGDVIAVIKEKDPIGRSDRWFVDNGKEKGFLSSNHLRKLSISEISSLKPDQTSLAISNATGTTSVGESSTVEGATALYPADDSKLPKYEDLYGDFEVVYENFHEQDVFDETDNKDHIYEELPDTADDSNIPPTKREIYQNIDSDDNQEEPDQFYYALYPFKATSANQLNLEEGQAVLLLSADDNGWWFVQNRYEKRGYVPSTYLSKYT